MHLHRAIQAAQDILDIGTSQRFAKELRPYEAWFTGKQYLAAGYHPSTLYGKDNCDSHQDIQAITYADASFDTVICLEVLEHVANPFLAAQEMYRVLRPGGFLFLTAPFLHQYHGKALEEHTPAHDRYPDFWRYTHQGLEQLFSMFRTVEVYPVDGPIEFRLKQLYFTRALSWPVVRALIDHIDKPRIGKATTRHLLLAQK